MDELDCIDELFTDFEIEDTETVDKILENENNEYESYEVEVPDDIDFEILEEIANKETQMSTIPPIQITVVDEKDIPIVVYHKKPTSTANEKPLLICNTCSKTYKRELFYAKHISMCQQQQQPKNDVKSDQGKELTTNTQGEEGLATAITHGTPETPIVSVKQKKSSLTGTLRNTDEELLEAAPDILESAIKACIDDPNHCRVLKKITPGNKIKIIAEKIYDVIKTDNSFLKSEARKIVHGYAEVIKSSDLTKSSSMETMWRKIREQMKSGALFTSWVDVISNDENAKQYRDSISGCIFHVTMCICLAIIKHENQILREKKDSSETVSSKDATFSKDEQSVVYYVAGYIVFSLLKKYRGILKKNPQNASAASAIEFFQTLKISSSINFSGNTLAEFTKEWTDVLDRGGLVKVSELMYSLVSSIESCVRLLLTVRFLSEYKGEDLRDVLIRKLEENKKISREWETLSRHIPSEYLQTHLKNQIFAKWVDIRAYAFVKSYVQILRRKSAEQMSAKKTTLSQASEKSLRKVLE